MTGLDIISRSLRLLNVLGKGETAQGDMAADALETLDEMLDSWRLNRLTIPQTARQTVSLLSGTATYTIGPSATINVTPLPYRIEAAAIIASGQTDENPLAVFTDQQYQEWRDKSATSTLPQAGVYLDKSFATATGRSNVIVLPTPSASGLTLVLYLLRPYVLFGDLSTDYPYLPDGWALAIRYNLAKLLKDEYPGTWDDKKETQAVESLADIQRLNEMPPTLSCDPLVTNRGLGGFDILTGG